jgi:esterase/lipase superfamily enzyme
MTGSRTVLGILLTVIGAVVALSSCVTRIPVDAQFNPESATYEAVVDLPFVTNRQLELDEDLGEFYGDGHGDLSAGRCKVGFEDGDRRGEVLRVDRVPLESVLPTSTAGPFVLYIHGYGESFARNCRRAALLQQRLELDGRMLLFSWPSSTYLTYAGDAADLRASHDQLNKVISLVSGSIGSDNLVLMAHSMGSRGIVAALKMRDDPAPRFHSVVLVAPDIQRDTFLRNVHILQEKVSDITVYMSDNDRVLWLSTTVNVSGRLGVASEFPIDVQHINVVDITPTGTNDISGHLYHLFNPAVIEDLQVMFGVRPRDAKRKYRRVAANTEGFWTLESATISD